MRKLLPLVKLNLRALLSAFKLSGGKKAKATGYGAVIFLAVLSVYIAGGYSFAFGSQLAAVGMLRYLIPMMAVIGCLLSVVMTVQAAVGFIFSGKDSDLMLSLPVSAFSVMLSRITALYIEHLIFVGLFMITSGVAAVVYGQGGVLFMVGLIICTLLLTLICTLLSTVIAFVVAFVTARFPHKAVIGTILYFAMFLLIMVGAFRVNSIGAMLLTNRSAFDKVLFGWLLPFGLTMEAAEGNLLSLLLLAVISVIPFLLIVWLFSSRYKKILSALSSHLVRSDYRLGQLQARSQLSALFRKEVRRYFGTSIYFFNTGFGAVMVLIAAVYAAFMREKAAPYIDLMGGMETVVPLGVLALGFFVATINTTCVSISIEGRTLWILKEAPVDVKSLFGSKVMVNLLVSWPSSIIAVLVLGIAYGADALTIVTSILVLMAMGLFVALMGLWVNLLLPKMDAVNDTMVVKQSASAVVGIFGGWVPVLAGWLGGYFLGKFMAFPMYELLFTCILLVSAAGLWHWLCRSGAKKLLSI